MKKKLLQVALILLAFNYIEASQAVEIDTKQINEMIKTDTVYIIGVDEKYKNKVKNFQSIGKGYLEYKSRKLNFANYKKDTNFVVFAKKDKVSRKALLEKPEGYVARPPRDNNSRGRDNRGRDNRRDDRKRD